MNNHHKEQLALFGKNRYHDWVVFFFAAIVLVVASTAYNAWLYISTDTLISGTEITQAPSQFEAFKEDLSILSSYIRSESGTSTLSIPADPSLR